MAQVTDLGQVLHMIGGTAAAFVIFFLPGLLLINAAIVKVDMPAGPTPSTDLDDIEVPPPPPPTRPIAAHTAQAVALASAATQDACPCLGIVVQPCL